MFVHLYSTSVTVGASLMSSVDVVMWSGRWPLPGKAAGIQACIPKDTAILWNHEFVQAEELFNQPFDYENCLRDNRFCGVLNSFVKRTSNGKHVSSLPPKPLNSAAAAA
uniref:Uncharacterized protein n=1 Tax=Zea mays TaxID=4577 RepID=A0A804QBC8_MAIZE